MSTTTQTITETLANTKALTFSFKSNEGSSNERDYLLDKNTILRRAEAGNVSAMFLAGMGYHQGTFGFSVNLGEATKWLQALKDGYKPGYESICADGYCLHYGLRGVEKKVYSAKGDYIGSDKYLPAKYLFITALYDEPFADKEKTQPLSARSISEARRDIMECVEKEFVPAIGFLGKRYLTDGWCVEVDKAEGLRLLKEAANKGDAPSAMFLGEVYGKGLHGVKADKNEAKLWFTLAASQNYPGASTALKQKGSCTIV